MSSIDLLDCPAPADLAPSLPAPDAAALSVLAAAALSACGGGGGASLAPAPPPAPSPPPPPPSPTDAEAARFLAQAGFAASAVDIATVKTQGYAAWLDAQMALPVSDGHFDWMVAKGYAVDANRNSFAGADNTIWRKFMSAPDTLRQRVVLALSEVFVVSMGAWRFSGVALWWRPTWTCWSSAPSAATVTCWTR